MATRIRLKRMGRKKRPFYRIVIADARSPRDGKFIESVGYYNPLAEPIELNINEEKVIDWLNNGAIPTETVKNLFSMKGINIKFDLMKKGFPENKIKEELQKHQLLQEEKLKRKALLKDLSKKSSEVKTEEKKESKKEETKEVEEDKQEIKTEEKQDKKEDNSNKE